jgi:PTS system ascorbate-specific IIC component
MSIVDILIQFLSTPALLIGLIALVGLIAQGKEVGSVIAGAVKTTLGFMIISAGAGVVTGAITPLGTLTEKGFGLQGALPVNEVFTALAQERFGQEISIVFALGFLISILIARFTPLKFVFLSGHHILFTAVLTVGLLSMSAVGSSKGLLIAVCSVLTGIFLLIDPWLSQPFMENLIGSKDFVMGHFGGPSYYMAGFFGLFVGKKEESTEDLEMPEWIGFMKEPLVAMAVVMYIIYLIASIAANGKVGMEETNAIFGTGNHWIVASLNAALTFAAGIGVILLGVRMILADIVPAFRGFAEKIVPGAQPCLDCPVTFPYGQNAVLVGYLSSIIGGVVVMLLQVAANGAIGAVIIPSMIIHFFIGATSAVVANSVGGWKAAVLGGFMSGVAFTLLAGPAYVALGKLGFSNSTFGDTGFGIIANFLSFFLHISPLQ